jgi:LCP family protein required for cell wall assembly
MRIGKTKRLVMVLMAMVLLVATTSCKPQQAQVQESTATIAPVEATADPATGETPAPTAEPDPLAALKNWQINPDKRIYNILLLGLDELDGTLWARNDTTMILQVDLDNNHMKLVSFMRDMQVDIPGHGEYRINNAHYRGGPELAMQTMKSVFGVKIDYYAVVDFVTFEQIMMIIGPIMIDIKDYEIKHIKDCTSAVSIDGEMIKGQGMIQNPGKQELNPYQALSLARDRHSSGANNERAGDFGRNLRQRNIIKASWEKVKTKQLAAIPASVFAASVYADTNMPPNLMITLLQKMMESNAQIEDMAIPMKKHHWAAWKQKGGESYSNDDLRAKYEAEKAAYEGTGSDNSGGEEPSGESSDKEAFPSYKTWRENNKYQSVIEWSKNKNTYALLDFLGIK